MPPIFTNVDELKSRTIEEVKWLVEQGELREALLKVRLLAHDCAPQKQSEVTVLMSRLNNWNREKRTGQPPTENLNVIIVSILELLNAVVQPATAKTSIMSSDTLIEESVGKFAGEPQPYHKVNSDDLRRYVIENRRRNTGVPEQIISAVNVQKTFHSGFSLGPISLTVKPGRVLVVIGKNGSGKSTLLRIIGGRLRPTSGSLTYPDLSTDHDWAAIRLKISYISSRRIATSANIRRSLEHVASSTGKTGPANREIVDDYLARYDLERFSGYSWRQLSDGYLMRFELVRALVSSPKLLILDEPLANLDINTRGTFLAELVELTRSLSNPMAIILSTHHVDEAELIADELLILDDGVSKFYGTKQALRQNIKGSVFHVLGEINVDAIVLARGVPGLESVRRVLGGVSMHFADVITVQELMARLQGLGNMGITSVIDVSASAQSILRDVEIL